MSESKHTPVAWLVATGATHEGRETYTRHEQRPPLCDAEPIYAPDLAAEVERLKSALTKISGIRDSMIGCQKVNWSEHVYPLVAALDAAGFEGASYEVARDQIGTLLERTNKAEAEVERLRAENDRLRAKLGNSPEPCAYCALPADKLLDCHMGFPGCPRADDMMLCGHFGAAMEAAGLRADLDAERRKVEALERDAALAVGRTAARCREMALWPQGIDDEQAFYGRMFAEFIDKEFGAQIRAALAATEGTKA